MCCDTTSLYEDEQVTRNIRDTVTIHRSLVLVENLNVEIYRQPPARGGSKGGGSPAGHGDA